MSFVSYIYSSHILCDLFSQGVRVCVWGVGKEGRDLSEFLVIHYSVGKN